MVVSYGNRARHVDALLRKLTTTTILARLMCAGSVAAIIGLSIRRAS